MSPARRIDGWAATYPAALVYLAKRVYGGLMARDDPQPKATDRGIQYLSREFVLEPKRVLSDLHSVRCAEQLYPAAADRSYGAQ